MHSIGKIQQKHLLNLIVGFLQVVSPIYWYPLHPREASLFPFPRTLPPCFRTDPLKGFIIAHLYGAFDESYRFEALNEILPVGRVFVVNGRIKHLVVTAFRRREFAEPGDQIA